jgi:hypothetical protein
LAVVIAEGTPLRIEEMRRLGVQQMRKKWDSMIKQQCESRPTEENKIVEQSELRKNKKYQ